MRLPSAILVLLFASSQFLLATGKKQGNTGTPGDTLSIATEYSVEIDYPNFVISILAHITGAHFSRVTLEEWDCNSPMPGSFLFHLSEGDNRWLELSSDSSFESFLTLPKSDRVVVSSGALKFARGLLQVFRSPSPDTVRAVFEYAGDTLGSRAFQQYALVDSALNVTTVSRIETWNRDTKEGYIDGDIRAVTRDGCTTYQDIRINLRNKNIQMHFTPINTAIARDGIQIYPGGSPTQNTLR